MKKKLLVIFGIIFTIAITASIGACIVLCTKTLNKIDKQNEGLKTEFTSQMTALKEELTKENEVDTEPEYVTIAGMYKIEDTSKISDAYKNNDDSELSNTDKETLKMASDILTEVTNDQMSLYEKEVAIHDWMVQNIKYDSNSLVAIPDNSNGLHTPHGVLNKKKAICAGYATTFKLFMNMLGADCKIVHSTDLSHSWDLVKLEDDKWYLTDITFDAGNSYISYANFNCSEQTFLQNHNWNTELYPKAEGRQYNYCVQNAKPVTDITKLPNMIKDAQEKKETNLFYLLPKGVDETYIQNISEGICSRVYESIDYSTNYTLTEDEQIVMAISMAYKGETPSEDDLTELNNTLDDLFGTPQY